LPVVTASGRTALRGHESNSPLRTPGYSNLNVSIGKNFSIAEGKTLEFKADMQNALNQTQYTNVSTSLSSPNFGEVTGTNGARIVQVQLRLAF
jgi:outer membrane receptor protein involved in Fe transport